MADETERREGGAWIGQHPDENTEQVRESLDEGADRVAVTDNEPGPAPREGEWPTGHRQGDHTTDDDVRRAGDSR